jgi:drug/metabolite transporter (DMT)-like permease
MNKKYMGPGSLLLIGILFGISGVIAKYLSSFLNPYQVVEYRFGIAFLVSLIILFITKQQFSFSKIDKKTLLLFAITFPVSVIFFTLAIFNTTVSLAVFSFYIANLVSSFIWGHIYFKEKITRNKQIALLFILLALVTFTNPFSNFHIELGFVFGIISGLFQTIASSYQKIVGAKTNRIGLLIIQTLAGTAIAAATLLLTQAPLFVAIPQITLLITILFGLIFLAISYLFLVGFKSTNLNVGSILVSSELFFGPFFAFILLSEGLTVIELLGGVLTGVAVYFANRD